MKTAERQRWLSFLRQTAGNQYEADARHGRLVRIAKIGLPAAAGLIVLLLLIWPALISGEAGFTLAFNEIKNRDDTLRMVQPRFEGVDSKGRAFTISADTAMGDAVTQNRVAMEQIVADIRARDGSWLAIDAPSGIYRPNDENLDLVGQVNIFSDLGYEVHARNLRVDLTEGAAISGDAVFGQGPFGVFKAGGVFADLDGEFVTFTNGVSMTVYPRAAKE